MSEASPITYKMGPEKLQTRPFDCSPVEGLQGVSMWDCNTDLENIGNISVFKGLNKEMVDVLIKMSKDPNDKALQKHTRDGQTRFESEESYIEWFKKGRVPYITLNDKGEILSLIWFGQQDIPAEYDFDGKNKDWHTIAFRSYGSFRGRKLMKDLSNLIIDEYLEEFPDSNLWLTVNSNNEFATKLYSKLGFIHKGLRHDKKRGTYRRLMVKEAPPKR